MFNKRSLTVFAVAFVVVLIGGAALAQVGSIDFGGTEPASADIFAGGADEDFAETPTEEPAPDEDGTKEHDEEPAPDEDGTKEHEEEQAPDEDGSKEEPPAKEEADTTPPEFGISFPKDNYETDDTVQVFEGFVEPGAIVTRGRYTAHQDGDGWRMELVLSPGKNHVIFVATDEAGNEAKASVTVHLVGHEEDKPKEEAKAFTANQKYGSCGEEVPYDVFFGTATPGAKIWVESPYGSGTTVAGEEGHWDIRVNFPEAPPGKVFEVVVESSDGGRKVFTFVNTGGEAGGHDG